MNKNFEQAYKRLAQNEIPDLWDRIEAGLKEKSAPVRETMQEGRIYDKAAKRENAEIGEGDNQQKKEAQPPIQGGIHPFINNMKRYSGVAAAVLCAAVVIPAALFLNRLRDGSNSASTAAPEAAMEFAEAAAEEECETAKSPTQESAEGIAEEPAEEAAAADESAEAPAEETEAGAVTEETGAMPAAERAETAAGGNAGASSEVTIKDAADDTAVDEKKSQKEDFSQNTTQQDREEAKRPVQGTALNNVVIEVTDIARDKDGLDGTWYTVLVKEDPSGYLQEGERITVFAPVHSSIALEMGAAFEVDIVYEEGEGYSFLLTGYHQKAA